MKASYLQKAENCLKSAKILFKNQLYENSISEACYCMYNSPLSLLFKTVIKSENHSASIIILKRLFNEDALCKIISFAKEERIDKQYYVESRQITKATKESCKDMALKSEDFLVKMNLLIGELSNEKINSIRNSLESLFY